jgi:hypothetical protein
MPSLCLDEAPGGDPTHLAARANDAMFAGIGTIPFDGAHQLIAE